MCFCLLSILMRKLTSHPQQERGNFQIKILYKFSTSKQVEELILGIRLNKDLSTNRIMV